MARNIPASKRGFGYDPVTRSLGVYVDGALVQSYPPTPGRTYFVNNITGASTNDGLSWANAMDQISTAITASDTYRELGGGAPDVTTNDYIYNTIVAQATYTAYTPLTELPQFANIIGLGADPSGNGYGIARIDGAGVADACDTSGTAVRGVNLYNLQFTQSVQGSVYGLDVAGAMYRSRIEHCGFTNNGQAGIHIAAGGSIVIDDCHTKADQFNCLYGMLTDAGGSFNNCSVTNSYFHGVTTAFLNASNSCNDTWINNCMFIGGTYGFVDTAADAQSDAHYLLCSHCFGRGTTGNTIGTGGFVITTSANSRFFNCFDSSGTASFVYPALS